MGYEAQLVGLAVRWAWDGTVGVIVTAVRGVEDDVGVEHGAYVVVQDANDTARTVHLPDSEWRDVQLVELGPCANDDCPTGATTSMDGAYWQPCEACETAAEHEAEVAHEARLERLWC